MLSVAGVNINYQNPGQMIASSVSANGSRPDVAGSGYHYEIDGVVAGQQADVGDISGGLLPEAVEEFRLSFNPNAESGWGFGTTMSVVTKSGTNRLHGTLYEYLRNDALDSRNWFAKKVSGNKQNEFGGVLGGPMIIPKVYDGKDRSFFFVTLDEYRYRLAAGGVAQLFPLRKCKGEILASG